MEDVIDTLSIIKECAKLAGKEILKIYNKDFTITSKTDSNNHRSPLTDADIIANNIITNSLTQHFPSHSILSEEVRDNLFRLNSQYVWIIDPLDGTKEFIHKNGEFTINIALVKDGVPILGVIYVPVTQQLFYSSKGDGAFLQTQGKTTQIHVSNFNTIKEMTLVRSRSHPSPRLNDFITNQNFKNIIISGSSIKGCLIANSTADLYVRLGPINEWDICAMSSILTEAGGKITHLDGSPIIFNQKDTLIKGFIASNDTIHEKIVDLVSQHASKRT